MERTRYLLFCLLLLATLLFPAAAADTRDVHSLTQNALLQLQTDTPAPVFSPVGGDWIVFSLARAGLLQPEDAYANNYYERIVQTVRETAPSVSLQNGALHPGSVPFHYPAGDKHFLGKHRDAGGLHGHSADCGPAGDG